MTDSTHFSCDRGKQASAATWRVGGWRNYVHRPLRCTYTHIRDGGGGGCTENAVCLHRVGQTIQNGVIVVVVVCELAFTASQKSEYYLSNLALASNALMHHSKQNKLPCVMYNAKEPVNIWHAIPYCK